MRFKKSEYLKLMGEDESAIYNLENYIVDTLPSKLYKFISLTDDYSGDFNDNLNLKKIKSLMSNKIWFSKIDKFNDPFELARLSIDDKEIYGTDTVSEENAKKLFSDSFEILKKNMLVACFSASAFDNISMWAHYTNNYDGFCCEYEIDKKFIKNENYAVNKQSLFGIRPIVYSKKLTHISKNFFLNYVSSEIKAIYECKMTDIQSMIKYMKLLTAEISFKDLSWSSEKEYRFYYRSNDTISEQNVSISKIGLKLKAIYAGLNCKIKNELKDIANTLKVDLYETYPSKNRYALEVSKLN